jgi:hypothetical protein
MESSVFYRRRKFMYLSIGLIATLGVMITYHQLGGMTQPHQQADAVTPKDKEVVLSDENESVSPLAARSFDPSSIACWLEGRPKFYECMTSSFLCFLPGWNRVPPSPPPPYCNVIY